MASPNTLVPAQRRVRARSTVDLLRALGSSGPVVSQGFEEGVNCDQLEVIRAIVKVTLPLIVSHVTGPIDPDTVDTAELLTSEIAANAIEHGSGLAYIEVRATLGAFAISVGDYNTSKRIPQIGQHSSPDDVSGRGLEIVDALSLIWGFKPVDPTNNTMPHETWCVIAVPAVDAYLRQPGQSSRPMAGIAAM
jgi:uncharacterized linocin/CFP29 family protein